MVSWVGFMDKVTDFPFRFARVCSIFMSTSVLMLDFHVSNLDMVLFETQISLAKSS